MYVLIQSLLFDRVVEPSAFDIGLSQSHTLCNYNTQVVIWGNLIDIDNFD